jgi:hypothetical protein
VFNLHSQIKRKKSCPKTSPESFYVWKSVVTPFSSILKKTHCFCWNIYMTRRIFVVLLMSILCKTLSWFEGLRPDSRPTKRQTTEQSQNTVVNPHVFLIPPKCMYGPAYIGYELWLTSSRENSEALLLYFFWFVKEVVFVERILHLVCFFLSDPFIRSLFSLACSKSPSFHLDWHPTHKCLLLNMP